MKKLLLSLAALAATAAQLSAQGISFTQGTWKSVVAKAAKEHKLIYMDVYTTWCGPCKQLAKNIFPQKEAGDKYNPLFVNYRVDAENGEGIALAKKYAVHGYPSHLFINPANQALVYRDMGYTEQVSEFNKHADNALAEYKDPMTWEKYNATFAAGARDTAFLKKYYDKADRLGKDGDANNIIAAYVAALGAAAPTDEQLEFLDEKVQAVNNPAIAYMAHYKDRLQALHPDEPNYFHDEAIQWIFRTNDLAVSTKNEALLNAIDSGVMTYTPDREGDRYDYRTKYYTETGDTVKAAAAAKAEAGYLITAPLSSLAAQDAFMTRQLEGQIREQLAAAHVPADKMDEMLQENMAKYKPQLEPALYTTQAADKLNNLAWAAYTKHPENTEALAWSKRATELVPENGTSWPAYADTYAHLLFAAGRRDEAMALEQKAYDRQNVTSPADAASMQEALNKMKAGKL